MSDPSLTLRNLRIEIVDGLATVTLTRPDRGNALDAEAGRDLRRAALLCSTDKSIRAVLLRAEGKTFCVGGDVKDFVQHDDLAAAVKDMTVDFHAAQAMFARMSAPMVCAINGAVAGAGLSLVAVCDYAVAARSSTFTYAYAGVGFTADGGLTWLLPRLMGLRRFQAFVLSGKSLDAKEALERGIVSEVVDDALVEEVALSVAKRLSNGPSLAYAGIKRLAQRAFSQGYDQHLEDEAQALVAVAGSKDAKSALAAIAERQRPAYTGT